MNTAVMRPKIGKSPFAAERPFKEPTFSDNQLGRLVWILPVVMLGIVVALLVRPENTAIPMAEANLNTPVIAAKEPPSVDKGEGVKIAAASAQGSLVGQMANTQTPPTVDSYSQQAHAAIDSNDTNRLLSIISKQ